MFSNVGQTLKELHLDDNPKILSLPKAFFHGLDKLEILDLSNMGLELLPNAFWSDLPALKKLKVSDNPFLWSLPKPTSYSLDLKNVDAGNCPKMPSKVIAWIKQNFDTRSLMLDFPINIYRSINHGRSFRSPSFDMIFDALKMKAFPYVLRSHREKNCRLRVRPIFANGIGMPIWIEIASLSEK